MLKKTFLTFQDASKELGVDYETLRQMLALGTLNAYIHPRSCPAQLLLYSFELDSKNPSAGSSPFATWSPATKPYPGAKGDYYLLTGWFKVEPHSLRKAAMLGSFHEAPWVEAPPECEGMFPGDVWELSVETYREYEGAPYFEEEFTVSASLSDLWFSADDVQKACGSHPNPERGSSSERALTTRERNNLLRIIAGLAKHAAIDVSSGKAAAQIEAAVAAAGFDGPKEKTIRAVVADLGSLD